MGPERPGILSSLPETTLIYQIIYKNELLQHGYRAERHQVGRHSRSIVRWRFLAAFLWSSLFPNAIIMPYMPRPPNKQNNAAGGVVKYFSYVVNESPEMLQALFGRKNLLHENATLRGYELCIQTAKEISGRISPGSPLKMSPREIIEKFFGSHYELYVIRANPRKSVPGKIWYVSPKEYEYLREWEMIEYGMSKDITAKALTDKGDSVTVRTYGLIKNAHKIAKVVKVDYRRKEAPSKKKLAHIRKVRKQYIERIRSAK